VLVLGSGAPSTLAQPTPEGWKTYYNPNLKFAIDYPLYSGGAPTNITESTDEVHFKLPPLGVTIKAYSNSPLGPEEFAVVMQQTMLENWKDAILQQGVETVVYNGELGYRFTVYTPSDGSYTEIMYFNSPNTDYKHYKVLFVGTNPVGGPPFETIDEFMNTIKFFD